MKQRVGNLHALRERMQERREWGREWEGEGGRGGYRGQNKVFLCEAAPLGVLLLLVILSGWVQ